MLAWTDLTVSDAEGIREFYSRVVGWRSEPVDMGDYSDFTMIPLEGSEPVAGVCHARGLNADLPPVWMVYIVVADIMASLEACREGGGEVLLGPKAMGHHEGPLKQDNPYGDGVDWYEYTYKHTANAAGDEGDGIKFIGVSIIDLFNNPNTYTFGTTINYDVTSPVVLNPTVTPAKAGRADETIDVRFSFPENVYQLECYGNLQGG